MQETFADFHMLAEKTRESVGSMAELTEKVADSLEEQLGGIRTVAHHIDNLSKVSEEMEQEMTKFKL